MKSNCKAVFNLALFLFVVFSFCLPELTKAQDSLEVRQPADGISVEEFWNSFDYNELNEAEKAIWKDLGWNEANWDGDAEDPASESKKYEELNEVEQSAVIKLGYTPEYWDKLLEEADEEEGEVKE